MIASVQSIGSLFSNGLLPVTSEPDYAPQLYCNPASDFVLCRDKNGNATAIYGESFWDFNPYRLSAKKIRKINFGKVFEVNGQEQRALIEEVKYLLYCLIYFAGGGRMGTLSASTLRSYWAVLRLAMQFSYEQKQRPMVGVLSLKQIFTVPIYLEAFVESKNLDQGALSGILNGLVRVGKERLGYEALNSSNFNLARPEYKQHGGLKDQVQHLR